MCTLATYLALARVPQDAPSGLYMVTTTNACAVRMHVALSRLVVTSAGAGLGRSDWRASSTDSAAVWVSERALDALIRLDAPAAFAALADWPDLVAILGVAYRRNEGVADAARDALVTAKQDVACRYGRARDALARLRRELQQDEARLVARMADADPNGSGGWLQAVYGDAMLSGIIRYGRALLAHDIARLEASVCH